VIGNRTRVKVKKNKVAPPFTECEFDIMYNEGISVTGDVLDLAVLHNIVDKRGAYFRYGDTLLGQGRENAKVFLAENPAFLEEMQGLIRNQAQLPAGMVAMPAGMLVGEDEGLGNGLGLEDEEF
jgi:recombination protein RecA